MNVIQLPVCQQCGGPLPPQTPGRGQPRKFCSDGCRYKGKNRRTRGGGFWSTNENLARIPPDPLSLRNRSLQTVADHLEGKPPAPPIDQLAQAVLEQQQILFHLRTVSPELPPQLRARADGFVLDVGEALRRHFGPITDESEGA